MNCDIGDIRSWHRYQVNDYYEAVCRLLPLNHRIVTKIGSTIVIMFLVLFIHV